MRVFSIALFAVLAAILVAGCGAAVESFQNDLQQQVGLNLPGGSKPVAPAPTGGSTATAPQTSADVSKDISISEMLAQHNSLRRQLGLGELRADATLTLVAQRQAGYNASIGTLQHEDANGGQCWDRADAAGYPWSNIGENLAMSTRPERIFELWKGSPGHYRNMTNPEFNEVGFAKVAAGRAEYWCAVFARRAK